MPKSSVTVVSLTSCVTYIIIEGIETSPGLFISTTLYGRIICGSQLGARTMHIRNATHVHRTYK